MFALFLLDLVVFFGTTFALFSKISASVWETNLFVAIIPLRGQQT
jgi:hypothetical protein